jgi:hypothetical protein
VSSLVIHRRSHLATTFLSLTLCLLLHASCHPHVHDSFPSPPTCPWLIPVISDMCPCPPCKNRLPKNALRNCQQALGKTPKGLILDIFLFFGRAPWKPNGAAGLLLTHAFPAVRGWGPIALCACAPSTRQSSAPERQLTLCGAMRTTLARAGAPVRAVT